MHKTYLNFTNLIDKIKIFILKLLRIRYLRRGKCKKCGNCCKTITFSIENSLVKDIKQFESLKRFVPGIYEHFNVNKRNDNDTLLFTCKYLNPNNTCKVYYFRSVYCILYPNLKSRYLDGGGETLPGCGYYYEPIESFNNVYNKLFCNSKKIK